MINDILSKIPPATLVRLGYYSTLTSHDLKETNNSILNSICCVLWDTGVLSFKEHEEVYFFYRNRLYNGGDTE